MKKNLFFIPLVLLIMFSLFFVSCGQQEEKKADATKETQVAEKAVPAEVEKKLKAGFIYVGPVGDYGWSHAHDLGKKAAEAKFPWLDTVIVESVAESDGARIIDRLVQEENCDVVFTTSFGYMDDTVAAGTRYPDKKFLHCSGFKNSENVGTYFGDLYQMYYLNGLMAGALTKSDKIGYVAAFPIPELIRHINAYALGVRAANPKAKVHVKWIYAWYGPDKAKEAAEALIAEGCDNLAFTEDTPAVIEVGQSHSAKGNQIYTYSHYSAMQPYGVDSVVSGQFMDWSGLYTRILEDIYNDKWTANYDLLWLAKEKAAILGGNDTDIINPKFVPDLKAAMIDSKEFGEISAYDLVVKRYEQMKQGREVFDPYTGPIYDNEGNLKIKEGEIAPIGDLLGIMYYVDGVEGSIPK